MERQIDLDLVTRLVGLSDTLSLYLPPGKTWHAVSPKFTTPRMYLAEYDISGKLSSLAEETTDLLVNLTAVDEDYDGEDYIAPFYHWEIYPPRAFSPFGRTEGGCNPHRNFSGARMNFFCPRPTQHIDQAQLQYFQKEGTLNVDLLGWVGDAPWYDQTRPQAIMMSMIEKDAQRGLRFAQWLLDGLQRAADIHPEEIEFHPDLSV